MSSANLRSPYHYLLPGFIAILLVELLCILWGNQGTLVYSLDDAYIHFALSENLMHGHYGVNSQEMSASSSSIIWPFLIAPLTLLPGTEWFVLIINGVFAVLSLIVIRQLVDPILRTDENVQTKQTHPLAYLLVFFFLASIGNLVGLVFTGMEHSLQVLLACLIVAGLWQVANNKQPFYALYLALIIIPLLRYESMALAAPALLYLLILRFWRGAILSGLCIAAVMVAFSTFLYTNNLGVLPTSILAKSGQNVEGSHALTKLISHAIANLKNPVGWLLLTCILGLIPAAISKKLSYRKNLFALTLLTAGSLHLMVGSLWWYGRYETYVFISMVLGVFLLYYQNIQTIWRANKFRPIITRLLLPLLVFSLPSIFIMLTTPFMSGAIYRQPYQFHRFVEDYYPHPVALNDLGLVSFRNSNYVLDLWGLASLRAMKNRQTQGSDPQWMDDLAVEYDVGLVFVTNAWFRKLPPQWIKIAEYNRNDFLVYNTAGMLGKVGFYATAPEHVDKAQLALRQFSQTLPEPVIITWPEQAE